MGQKYVMQTCRLVAPERLPDRFLASGVLTEETVSVNRVVLAYVFEVTKPWFPSSRLLATLVDTLSAQFPQLTGKGLDDQFEKLLKVINRELNSISEAGETDWIGNFNALIMALYGDELHFAQTGFCPTYILQNNRIRQITDDSEHEHDLHPLKTFSSLASGTVTENDAILIANQELYREISLDALRRIMNSSSPYQASLTIAKELKKEKNPKVTAVIVRALSQSTVENQASPEPNEVWLEEAMQGRLKQVKQKLAPVLTRVAKAVPKRLPLPLPTAKPPAPATPSAVAPEAAAQPDTELEAPTTEEVPAEDNTAPEIEPDGTPGASMDSVPAEQVSPEGETDAVESPEASVTQSGSDTPAVPVADDATASDATTDGATGEDAPAEPPDEATKHRQALAEVAEAHAKEVYRSTHPTADSSDPEDDSTARHETIVPISEFALDSSVPVPPQPETPLPTRLLTALVSLLNPLRAALAPRLSSLGGRLLPLIDRVRTPALRFLAVPKNRKITALVLAVVLIGGTAWSATHKRSSRTGSEGSSSANATLLSEAETLAAKVTSAIDLQQQVEAARTITEAQEVLNRLQSPSEAEREQADAIWDSITTQSDTLYQVTRLSGGSTAQFTDTSSSLLVRLPYFYGFTSSGDSLLRSGKGESTATQLAVPLPTSSDSILSLCASSEDGVAGYALTRENQIYRILQSSERTSLTALSLDGGSVMPGDSIQTYNQNLYVLDGKVGLIWRYPHAGSGFGKGTSLIDGTKYSIKDSVSLAIDGAIYVLMRDGSVKKFSGGKQVDDFTLHSQPANALELVRPLQIITDSTMNSLYILDAGMSSGERSTARVLEYEKDGTFIRQYAFPRDYTSVQSFAIDPQAHKLWILNASSVTEFDI